MSPPCRRTVAHIAAGLGYADASTFGAVFARHTGRRPRDYRATFRRSPAEPVGDIPHEPGTR
ncbi:helix-turn-helix domain-containing protein [Streptomyces sp. NPDC048291]|uniref:helix-turn-helix domain-containing protein n=1 Tax=Streptomyces sp. NPDC048291 TaxID=3365530 RepID=UPI00371CD4C8